MRDPHDRVTIDYIPKEKTMKFKVNYGFAVKGKIRSGALLIEAKDIRAAKDEANKQLAAEHDWHQVNSIIDVTPKT